MLARALRGLPHAGSFLRHAVCEVGARPKSGRLAYRGARSFERVRCHLGEVSKSTRRSAANSQVNANGNSNIGFGPGSALVLVLILVRARASAPRRTAASTPVQLASNAPDAFEGTRPTGGALPTRDACVLANDKAQERSRMRKPVKRRRKQSADAVRNSNQQPAGSVPAVPEDGRSLSAK